jgi:hypothetical protein
MQQHCSLFLCAAGSLLRAIRRAPLLGPLLRGRRVAGSRRHAPAPAPRTLTPLGCAVAVQAGGSKAAAAVAVGVSRPPPLLMAQTRNWSGCLGASPAGMGAGVVGAGGGVAGAAGARRSAGLIGLDASPSLAW